MKAVQEISAFGEGDSSFKAAGGEPGIRQLVDSFYDFMEALPEAADIRGMHSSDLTISRDKLACFICGWLGGPNRYEEKYGAIRIPAAHAHLPVGYSERDAWLFCMQKALDQQPYDPDFKNYLYQQFCVPAELIRKVSQGDQ